MAFSSKSSLSKSKRKRQWQGAIERQVDKHNFFVISSSREKSEWISSKSKFTLIGLFPLVWECNFIRNVDSLPMTHGNYHNYENFIPYIFDIDALVAHDWLELCKVCLSRSYYLHILKLSPNVNFQCLRIILKWTSSNLCWHKWRLWRLTMHLSKGSSKTRLLNRSSISQIARRWLHFTGNKDATSLLKAWYSWVRPYGPYPLMCSDSNQLGTDCLVMRAPTRASKGSYISTCSTSSNH